jgi:hypothetical protein
LNLIFWVKVGLLWYNFIFENKTPDCFKEIPMTLVSLRRFAQASVLLVALLVGLLAASGTALAATRTVIGELYSADG